ncbi:MAG: histone deacetylase [Planctomycetales bacterium]|nr:histone deacetylase [Planctomycetales bacterium]
MTTNKSAILYRDNCFLKHDTGAHPEKAARLEHLYRRLDESTVDDAYTIRGAIAADVETIRRVHSEEHIRNIEEYATKGGGRIEADTVMSTESYNVAVNAVGTSCDAVTRVIEEQDVSHAVCLIRPPGHHALPKRPMGFCLFNNVAVAARHATAKHSLNRILIVDWDVHHGNGTQDTFWEDEQVAFFSIHRWPFYPGTGAKDETGSGKGLGTNLNLPVEFGTSREDYLSAFKSELERFADKVKPELVLISAGFDSHRLDPIGSLGLETEDFATLTSIVANVANTHAGGKIVSLLEGGYNVQVLPDCVLTHLQTLTECRKDKA